jgi:hypothetical protein
MRHGLEIRIQNADCNSHNSTKILTLIIAMLKKLRRAEGGTKFWGISCEKSRFYANISAISWQPVLVVEEVGITRREPLTMGKSLTNFITECCIK